MKSLTWSRGAVLAELREDIWRYLTQAATDEDHLVLHAAALLQMRVTEVRILAELQFVLSDTVRRFLEQVPSMMRRLATTTAAEIELSAERIRGPIRWGETFAHRAASGGAPMYITAPSRRAFDTAENRVLAAALQAIVDIGRRTGWHHGTTEGPSVLVRRRVDEAARWLQARPLMDVSRSVPAPTVVQRVRLGRHSPRYAAAVDVLELRQRYIARLDRHAIRQAVERHALLVRRDSVLFELQATLGVIAALREMGWVTPPDGLLRPPRVFRGRRDGAEVDVWFQHTPHQLSSGSRYRRIQHVHGFAAAGAMLPDLVLRRKDADSVKWLLIEVKMGTVRGVEESARAAVRDLLAYRRAFGPVLTSQPGPYGLGVAWGAEMTPSADGDVVLCTPDTLSSALALVVG